MKKLKEHCWTEKHKKVYYSIYKKLSLVEHYCNDKLIETNTKDSPKDLVPFDLKYNENKTFVELWEEAKEISKTSKIENIYYLYIYGNILFDKDLNIVPTLYKFDYIGTPFSNEKLYLEKAIKHLKIHPWIKYVSEIKDIPYYNSSEKCSKYIEVHMLPDLKTYNKLYQKYKNEEYWSVRLKEAIHDFYMPTKENNLIGLYPECVKPVVED